jgi:hypothetical protein
MAQYGTPDVAVAGLMDGGRWVVESANPQENINFGAPVFGMVGVERAAYNFHNEIATITLSTDLIAANVISVTYAGITVSETFASTHAATMTALVAAIKVDLAAYVSDASVTGDVLTITFKPQYDATVTAAVTLGTTQPTITNAVSTARVFLGVAPFVQLGGAAYGAGTATYQALGDMNIVTRGRIWVLAAATVSDKDPAYVIKGAGTTMGTFTDVSTNNYNIGGFFRSNYTGGFALLEINGMK